MKSLIKYLAIRGYKSHLKRGYKSHLLTHFISKPLYSIAAKPFGSPDRPKKNVFCNNAKGNGSF
jgi:hypothetical protein